MQKRLQHSRSALPDFKEILRHGSDEILGHWLKSVRGDFSIPSSEGMDEPLLINAVPLVLDEILRVIELDNHKIEHERISSAARHGRERANEHFDVKELVREYQLLREHVFFFLHTHAHKLSHGNTSDAAMIYTRVGLAFDEAVRETVNAFVEEHVAPLRRLARIDSVTGLYNHRIFYERLADELNRAKRYESRLSLVLIDLDNFKVVNDTKGHPFGDHLLIQCADILRRELRQTDIICRYGGDEFGLILIETCRDDAIKMMVRLKEAFKELGTTEGAPVSFGMSYGLSSYPEDVGTVRQLVSVADQHLILNKKSDKAGLAKLNKVVANFVRK